jgi:hypothetical protein
MATTPNSKRHDTRPPKRKRDTAEVDRQVKHQQKRIKKRNSETNGVLSGSNQAVVPDDTTEAVNAESSALQLVTKGAKSAADGHATQVAKQEDAQTPGWSISRPLGGRISDLDPILTPDER